MKNWLLTRKQISFTQGFSIATYSLVASNYQAILTIATIKEIIKSFFNRFIKPSGKDFLLASISKVDKPLLLILPLSPTPVPETQNNSPCDHLLILESYRDIITSASEVLILLLLFLVLLTLIFSFALVLILNFKLIRKLKWRKEIKISDLSLDKFIESISIICSFEYVLVKLTIIKIILISVKLTRNILRGILIRGFIALFLLILIYLFDLQDYIPSFLTAKLSATYTTEFFRWMMISTNIINIPFYFEVEGLAYLLELIWNKLILNLNISLEETNVNPFPHLPKLEDVLFAAPIEVSTISSVSNLNENNYLPLIILGGISILVIGVLCLYLNNKISNLESTLEELKNNGEELRNKLKEFGNVEYNQSIHDKAIDYNYYSANSRALIGNNENSIRDLQHDVYHNTNLTQWLEDKALTLTNQQSILEGKILSVTNPQSILGEQLKGISRIISVDRETNSINEVLFENRMTTVELSNASLESKELVLESLIDDLM